MSPSEFPQYHPDYSAGQSLIFGGGDGDANADRCECGGIRYWHATATGGGCDDCACPEFKATE